MEPMVSGSSKGTAGRPPARGRRTEDAPAPAPAAPAGPRPSRRTVLAAALGLAAAPRALAQARRLDRIAIVLAAGPLSLTFHELMRQQGFMEKFDLAAETSFVADGNRLSGSRILGSLFSGEIDLCPAASFSTVLAAIGKGAPLRLVNGAVIRGQTTIFTANPDVRAVADLAGRTVAVSGIGSQLHQATAALLAAHGVDPARVAFVTAGGGEAVRSVAARIVDAAPASIDFIPQRERFGIRQLAGGDMWTSLPDLPFLGGFATQRTIAARREPMVRCLAAYGALFRFITGLESRAAWKEARRRALGGSGPEFEEVSDFQVDFMRRVHTLGVDLVLSAAQVDAVQALNLQSGAQQKRLAYEAAADMSLAADAVKLLGGPA
jgi:NitT/TauT family transport system substrate-binding protein